MTCTSDSQLGLRAAVLAVIVHAENLIPDGLRVLADPRLPVLGDLEFVLMRRRTTLSAPEQVLCDAIVASARRFG